MLINFQQIYTAPNLINAPEVGAAEEPAWMRANHRCAQLLFAGNQGRYILLPVE
jgi:hypothetical protein